MARNGYVEIIFKKYFWTVTLGFLLVGALVSAKIINTFIAAKVRALPGAAAGPAPVRPRAVVRRGGKDVRGVIARNIFNSEAKPTPVAPPPTPTPPTADPGAPAQESDLDVTLIAVILTDHPLWSFAQIKERRGQDAKLYKIGDMIRDEAKIIGMEWRKVIILRNGRREVLNMFAPRKVRRRRPRFGRRSRRPRVSVNQRNIKRVGRDRYVIAREEVEKQLSNLNYLATQARIVPHFERGRGAGFKLFAIRPGSLYSKIGIRNGDVVKRINGEVINSPDKALEAYARLKTASQIVIDMVRGGRKRTLVYNISQ